MHIIISYIRSGRKTKSNFEDFFFYSVRIERSIRINRLLVHRLPYRTCLNPLGKHEYTECLHILIRLTIRRSTIYSFDHTGSTTHSRLM